MGRSRDHSRDHSRDRSRDHLHDRSWDRARDRSRNDERDRGKRSERDVLVGFERSRDREIARLNRVESGDRTQRSRSRSLAEELREMMAKLKRKLRNLQARPARDEHTVPVFDPSRDSADIEQWVQHVNQLTRRYD